MDIQRTVLWVVFSFSLLMLWDKAMVYNGKSSMLFPSVNQQAKPAPASSSGGSKPDSVPATSTAATTAPGNTAEATPVAGERIKITTDIYKAEIDTVGGELKYLELLKHKDSLDPGKNVVLFQASAAQTYLAESGLIGGPFPNHKSLFAAQPGPRTLDGANQLQLVLESEQDGVKLIKTYTFKRGDYSIGLKHEVVNNGAAAVTPALYLQLVRDGNKPPHKTSILGFDPVSTFTGPTIYTDSDKFQKVDFEKIEKGKAEHATKTDNGWIAMVQHYFVSALITPDKAQREVFTKKVGNNLYAVGTVLPLGTVAPGAKVASEALLYSGPQESATLEKLAPDLELVRDYGVFTILAKPIFWLMNRIHMILGNWGWSIILLTVIIKLLFFPLSAASYRSMAKMKQVTPKLQSIRERFKSDPQKMNMAMMELYKTEKINPLGGCLPVVIQIPVFIALYSVLLASVEMRNAPWLGWIHDLASPDPFYILPVVMAISMFIQTKLNPTPPDPVQAKVMMVMPIVFSVMFFFFPAGLVLYWVVNNILSIAQQWVITRSIEGRKAA